VSCASYIRQTDTSLAGWSTTNSYESDDAAAGDIDEFVCSGAGSNAESESIHERRKFEHWKT